MKRFALMVLGCLVLPSFAFGDIVRLKDGSTLEGELKRSGDGYIVTDSNGKATSVTADRVASIEIKPSGGPQAAMARLQSLRRAADNLPDIKQIIERYESFLAQNKGTPAADAAKGDLELWKDRQAKGMVKVGDKWVTPSERDALRGKTSIVAADLHDMIKHGRLKEAGALLDKSLAIDPQSISLLYLRGVLQYQQDQIGPARKSFDAVAALAPDHAPTLNNLAVILWRANAVAGAMQFYERAMLAAPGSREILDNVAEALNALPKEQRETPVTKKVVRTFKQQDEDLQKQMADKGLHRWGSSWVNDKDLAKLEEEEKAVNDRLQKMQDDYDQITRNMSAIDQNITNLQTQMAYMQQQSIVQDQTTGRIYRLPLPQAYYDDFKEIERMRLDKQSMVAEQERMRKKAQTEKQKVPKPKYTGMQRIIDADGMPVPTGAAGPTTKPASK